MPPSRVPPVLRVLRIMVVFSTPPAGVSETWSELE